MDYLYVIITSGQKNMATTVHRKRGPVPKPGRVRVTLYLDSTLADWGKRQKGGLSDLVRNLLVEAQRRDSPTQDRYPADLRIAYQRLINRKLESGLSAAEEEALAAIRQRINAIDRASPEWQIAEQAASAIDQELQALRAEIEALPER